jgi:2'-5' RNA ligase
MFVALDLPERPRAAIAAWRDVLVAGRRDLRPVPPDHLHVTLAFLGWQDEAEAERIAETAFGAAHGLAAPLLAAASVRPLPPRDPRLFALDLDDEGGRATELQAAVAAALERERVYRPERRPFWPHLTLARVKRRERRVRPLPERPVPTGPFEAADLTLYRSTLRPQGALYEPLGQARIG